MRTLHPKTRRWIAPLCTLFLALACTPWQAHALTFNDVDVTTPHQEDIVWLAENGISTGYPGGLFKPMTDVYRQDMAAFLYRLAGKPDYAPTPADKARFKDVNDQTPHAKEIYWLAASGISTGYLDGTFKPLAPVVRQDMAAFLRRLAKVMGDPESESWKPQNTNAFPDVTAQTDHREDILWLAETEISEGYPNKTFQPLVKVARQDMAAFLHRLNDHVAEHELAKPTDSYAFGEDKGFKYILITDGSKYDIFDLVWTTPGGLPINYFGEGLYVYEYVGKDKDGTLSIPASLDGHNVKVAKFGRHAAPNSFTTIDATSAKDLEVFFSSVEQVSAIKLDNLQHLERVNAGGKNLTNISFDNCKALWEILISYTKVSSIDLSTLPELYNLQVDNNELTSLDISNNPKLSMLACQRNRIADTSQLEAWLTQPGHSGAVLPQKQNVSTPTESTWNGCRIIKAPAECGCEMGQIIGYADNGQKITYDSPGVYIASVPASLQKLTLPESIDGLPVVSVTLEESDSGPTSSLTTIDARAAKQLELIWTKTSRLGTVLIDNLAKLETMILEKCPLTEINLNGCERLSTLILNVTKISSLDLSHCPNLMTLGCTFSQLTELDITPCRRLQDLNCGGNYISDTSKLEAWLKMPNHTGQVGQQASIHKNTRLESSSGYTYIVVDKDSGITWGDVVAKTTNGAYLYYRGEGVYVLETNENGAVTLPSTLNGMPLRAVSLGSSYGDVASIDASKANSLTSLQLACPNLEAVDVHGLKTLDQFSVLESNLSSLDITGCSGLSSLTIRNSNITSLDLSSATNLLSLIVDRNELEHLDVSPCKSLTYLDCSLNRITDTSALTTWLAQPGHSGTCLPQNV